MLNKELLNSILLLSCPSLLAVASRLQSIHAALESKDASFCTESDTIQASAQVQLGYTVVDRFGSNEDLLSKARN